MSGQQKNWYMILHVLQVLITKMVEECHKAEPKTMHLQNQENL